MPASRIPIQSRIAAHVVGIFVRPYVRMYTKPVAIASVLWASWCWFKTGELDETGLALYLGTAVVLVIRALAFREAGKLPKRYYDAFARSDADELAALSKLFRLFHPDADERAVHVRMRLGEEMIVRKNWLAARQALAGLELGYFPAYSRAVLLNNLAYATARSGDPEGALAIVKNAFAEAEKAPREKMAPAMPTLRGTKGIALTLAGRHDEALALLEAGVEEGTARSRNERAYWLGRAYRLLGRHDEARASFARAIEIGGPCDDEARTALAETTSPFRG